MGQSGELLFITGIGIKNDSGDLADLVKKGAAKKIAGLVINVGPYIAKAPQEIIDLADELHFPVFELPWKVKLAEVTKDICAYIVEKQAEDKSIRDLFENILYGNIKYLDMLVTRAAYYGFDLLQPQQIILLKIDHLAAFLDKIGLKNEGRIINIKTTKQKLIEKVLGKL